MLEGLDRRCFSRLQLPLWAVASLCPRLLWVMRELGPCPLPSALRSLAWVGTPSALQFILAFAG